MEALRQHEERTYLIAQDERTKMNSAALTDKVRHFRTKMRNYRTKMRNYRTHCPPFPHSLTRCAISGSRMYVCMIHTYVCMYMYVYTYVCISMYVYLCMYIGGPFLARVLMYVCIHAYVCMYIHTCCVLTKPPIPSSRCKCFVFLRPV